MYEKMLSEFLFSFNNSASVTETTKSPFIALPPLFLTAKSSCTSSRGANFFTFEVIVAFATLPRTKNSR